MNARSAGRVATSGLEDVLFACRRLRTQPASGIGPVVMLTVGIALSASMFALSDPYLSRPLPWTRADRLVLINVDLLFNPRDADYPLLSEWQDRTDLFDGLAAFVRRGPLRARLRERVVALETVAVSANFLEVLRPSPIPSLPVSPALTGSGFADEAWITGRGATGPLAGTGFRDRTIPLEPSGSLNVLGQLPASFLLPDPYVRTPVDALVALEPGPMPIVLVDGSGTIQRPLRLVGRLRDGIEPSRVEADLNAAAAPRRFRVTVTPLVDAMKAPLRRLAAGGLLAGLLVMLVCAINAAGMALTRGLHRIEQVVTMEMLGATWIRVSRMLLAEALLVAAASCAGALALGGVLMHVVRAIVPTNFIVLGQPELSSRVVAFVCLAGLLACTAWWAGSLIAWRPAVRPRPGGRTLRYTPAAPAVRFILTSGQVAVTLVLLAGAGLLGRSYLNLVRQDTGMTGETLALSVSYPPDVSGGRLQETIAETLDHLAREPGVRQAAATVGQMVDSFEMVGLMLIQGRPVRVERLQVTAGYFDAAGMSFVAGRPLTQADAGRKGVVINEALVNRHLGGRGGVGDLVRLGDSVIPVVGIVRDARRRALDEAPRPAAFLVLDEPAAGMRVTYLIAGSSPTIGVWESIVRQVYPDAVLLDSGPIRDRLARSVQNRTFATVIVVLFALATVSVTAAGLIGVVAYVVARRTREAGIRIALGAQPARVSWLMMRDAVAATAVGVAAGLVGVVWLSGSVSSLLYGVSPTDWPTLAIVVGALVAICTAAAMVPARRAGRLPPTVALRE